MRLDLRRPSSVYVQDKHHTSLGEFKTRAPFGQLPVLEFVDSGKLLAQSLAIGAPSLYEVVATCCLPHISLFLALCAHCTAHSPSMLLPSS